MNVLAVSFGVLAAFCAFMAADSVNKKQYASAVWFALCGIFSAIYGSAML
jgi:hypothetical protein